VVNLDFVMLTEYAADIKVACAYPPASLANTFGEWMAKNDKTSCVSPKRKNTLT
jgi:2,3-bisphosphoglycerate-independent phosphoglycerate mutase